MSMITVTAADGVRAKVTVQRKETLTREIPALHDSAGRVALEARTETFETYVDISVVNFASESREFYVDGVTRVLVEEQN